MHTDPTTVCDNAVAAMLVTDMAHRVLLIRRATQPHGWAPPAGHVSEHADLTGTSFDHAFALAAVREVHEETGISPDPARLSLTYDRWVDNRCRRRIAEHGRVGHHWRVFSTDAWTGTATAESPEVHQVGWYGAAHVEWLAHRTVAYATGGMSRETWDTDPGLEPVWVWHLRVLGQLPNLVDRDVLACLALAQNEVPR